MRLTAFRLNTALAVLLVVAGIGAWFALRDAAPSQASTARTTRVTRGAVTATISGTGNVASSTSANVNFSGSGTLTSVRVKAGVKVAKNAELARIDPTDAQQQLASAKASLAQVQADYDTTMAGVTSVQATKDRLQVQAAQLKVDSAGSQLDDAVDKSGSDSDAADQARQQLAEARNDLAQAKASRAENAARPTAAERAKARADLLAAKNSVTAAQQDVDRTVLRAPFEGTVLSVNAAVGDSVSGGSSSSSSSSSSGSAGTGSTTGSSSTTSSGFITMANLTTLEVSANVAEADIGSVALGQTASVTLSASSTTVTGRVSEIAEQGTTSNNVVQYPITVTLDEAPAGVRLGASASVTVTTGSKQDVLTLPSSAITTLGRRSTVTVLADGVQRVAAVETGLVGNATTEITSGITENTEVVLPTTTATGSGNTVPRFGGAGGGLGGGLGGRP